MLETTYDREIRERKEKELDFKCPPILAKGINNYQMTCNDCPTHVKQLCQEARLKKERQKE